MPATIVALAVATPAALADEHVARSGHTTATFSFERQSEYEFTDLWLTVERAGAKIFDKPVETPNCNEPYCLPAGIVVQDSDTIRVNDLDTDCEPEVLVDVYTGGAHRCFATEILRFDGSSYRASSRNWGDRGYRLVDPDDDGRPEFLTADARFAYAFSSFADSAFPIRALAWSSGRFTNITRRRTALIRQDAKHWKHTYLRRRDGHRALGVQPRWCVSPPSRGPAAALPPPVASPGRACGRRP